MTLKVNTAEGGSDGVSVTTGNSGGASGDAFNGVTSTAPTFEADHPTHGAMGYKSSLSAESQARVTWTLTAAALWARMAIYATSLPASDSQLILALDATQSNIRGQVRLTTAGALQIWSSSSNVGTASTTVSTGTAYGLEVRFTAGTTTADLIELRVYSGANFQAAPIETVHASSATVGSLAAVSYGVRAASGSQTWSGLHFDSLGLSDVTWVGNDGLPTSAPLPSPRMNPLTRNLIVR